jgi:hypothetical protein
MDQKCEPLVMHAAFETRRVRRAAATAKLSGRSVLLDRQSRTLVRWQDAAKADIALRLGLTARRPCCAMIQAMV